MTLRADETIDPQLGVGGWAPRPMKLSPDSSSIAAPSASDAWTISGARIAGRTALRST